MENEQLLAILKTFVLFQSLDDIILREISENLQFETFSAGSIIITQGKEGDKIYFIVKGTAEAYIQDKSGQDAVIGILRPGDYFGEMALLATGFRACSVRAVESCELISLSREYFKKLSESNMQIIKAINVLLMERLNNTISYISEVKSIIIVMIYSDEALARIKHFENYFRKLTAKPILMVDGDKSLDEFKKQSRQAKNSFIFVKTKGDLLNSIDKKADYIINFVEKKEGHYSLLPDATPWQIEHVVRVINKKTVGIALCSGGAPGCAHLGVLKVLHEENIPLDYIVGTSAGAFYGGCYTFGYSMNQIIESVVDEIRLSHNMLAYLKNASFRFTGLLRRSFFRQFFYNIFGDKKIEDALIPFAAVGSDLYSGNSFIIKSGSIVDAVLISSSPPVLIEPYITDEHFLVDGVVTDPLPTKTLVEEKIDIKIAVPIPQLDLTIKMSKHAKMLAIYLRSRSVMAEKMTKLSLELADVIIRPRVESIMVLDWNSIHRVVEEGEIAARAAVKRIRFLLEENNR